jgi:hypothetical protein
MIAPGRVASAGHRMAVTLNLVQGPVLHRSAASTLDAEPSSARRTRLASTRGDHALGAGPAGLPSCGAVELPGRRGCRAAVTAELPHRGVAELPPESKWGLALPPAPNIPGSRSLRLGEAITRWVGGFRRAANAVSGPRGSRPGREAWAVPCGSGQGRGLHALSPFPKRPGRLRAPFASKSPADPGVSPSPAVPGFGREPELPSSPSVGSKRTRTPDPPRLALPRERQAFPQRSPSRLMQAGANSLSAFRRRTPLSKASLRAGTLSRLRFKANPDPPPPGLPLRSKLPNLDPFAPSSRSEPRSSAAGSSAEEQAPRPGPVRDFVSKRTPILRRRIVRPGASSRAWTRSRLRLEANLDPPPQASVREASFPSSCPSHAPNRSKLRSVPCRTAAGAEASMRPVRIGPA